MGTERARLAKIESGLCSERARLGTFRGSGTESVRPGTFRGFGTDRARLSIFRGFGTERARLGSFLQNFEILTQNEHLPTQRFFFLILGENPKIVLNIGVLTKKNRPPTSLNF